VVESEGDLEWAPQLWPSNASFQVAFLPSKPSLYFTGSLFANEVAASQLAPT